MKDFGILKHRIPKHLKYMTEESRISSFDKWPKTDMINPVELAKAGFYYTGTYIRRRTLLLRDNLDVFTRVSCCRLQGLMI